MLDQIGACSAVSTAKEVKEGMTAFIAKTGADELMLVASIFDHDKRLATFEIAAEAGRGL